MRRRRNSKFILFLGLILLISVGYALISTTLNINGIAGFKSNTWKVVWDSDSVEVSSGSVSSVDPVVNSSKDTVSYTADLTLPGDFYEFTVDAVNEGTIDAVLSVNALLPVVYNEDGEEIELPEGLIYKVKYADGGEVKKNHLIKAGEREKYRVRIEYDKDAENVLDEAQIRIETRVPYEQTNKDAIDRDTEKYTITFNPNGGDVDEATKKVVMELPIGELPTPIRTGYIFDGWYTELEEGTKIDENTIPDGNLTYYAHWTERVSTFDTGQNVNAKIKKLAGDTLPETRPYSVNDTSITSFERSNVSPDINSMTTDNIISAENSEPIYAWYDNGTIYWWSEANSANLNADSSYLFNGMKSLANLSLDNLYSSGVTTLQGAFGGVGLTSLDLTKLDTSNVTNMGSMFSGTSFETLDLSKLDTSRVTNMSGMFSNADLNNIDLTKLDISNVTNMTAMFNWSKKTSFDLRSWDTSNVTDMTAMFASTTTTSINISGWNASKVTDMTTMFSSTTATSIDLSGMDVSKVTSFDGLVSGASSLKNIDISGWNFAGVTSLSGFFNYGLTNLETITMDNVDTSSITNMTSMFQNLSKVTELDLSDLDTENVTNMTTMFYGCSNLTTINLSGFDTQNVVYFSAMFYGNKSLTKLDLSNFNTSSATDMNSMFCNCSSLKELNLSNWDFSKYAVSSSLMMNVSGGGFSSLEKFILDNTKYGSSLNYAFGGLDTVKEYSFNNIDTSNVTNMSSLFYNNACLLSLDLSEFDTSNVTDIGGMFLNCAALSKLDLSNFNTTKLTIIGSAFSGCSSLKELNLSNFDFSKCNNTGSLMMSASGGGFSSLQILILDNTTYNANMYNAFAGLSTVKEYSFKNVNTSNVTNMSYMFARNSNLVSLNLSDFDTSNVSNMDCMFQTCPKLTGIVVGDNFVVDQVTSSGAMFQGNASLVGGNGTIYDSSHIDKEYAHYDYGESNPGYFNRENANYVVFNANGGDVYPSLKYINSGSSIGELPTPTREHYQFDGWYTEIIGGIKIDATYVPSDKTTVYARWVENPNHVIRFDSNGGNINTSSKLKKVYEGDSMGTMPTTSRSYYIFVGWFTAKEGGEEITSSYVPTGDMILYARWRNYNNYVVTFNPNGGSVNPVSKSVKERSSIGTLPTPTRTNYAFDGWYTLPEDGVRVSSTYIVNEDITLYAHWNKTNYVVTFDANGGEVDSTEKSVKIGNTIGNLPTPTRENHIFYGWYTSKDWENLDPINSSYKPTDDVTLYAIWEEELITMFEQGKKFNYITQTLSGEKYDAGNYSEYIREYKYANSLKDGMTDDNIVSVEGSEYPIYAWYEIDSGYSYDDEHYTGVIYIYSEADELYTNMDASYMFSANGSLKNIDILDRFNTSKTKNMSNMFCNAYQVEYLDLSNWDFSNVENMGSMFSYLPNLVYLDLGTVNNTKIKQSNIFVNDYTEPNNYYSFDDFKKFKAKNFYLAGDMSYGFSSIPCIEGIETWDTSRVTNMKGMFLSYGTDLDIESLDLSNFDTSNVTDMSHMFYDISVKIIDLSNFNTSNVTNTSEMFSDNDLEIIFVNDNLDFSNVTNSESMFYNSSAIIGGNGTVYDENHIDKEYARIDTPDTPGYFTLKDGWVLINRCNMQYPSYGANLLKQQWSYFDEGVMIESGFHILNDMYGTPQKYYFVNGVVQLGWIHIDGYYYYLSTEDDDGNGYVNASAYRNVTKTIDGVSYTFDSEGRCTNYNQNSFNTVTYNANGGLLFPSVVNVSPSTAIGELPKPTRQGYFFIGWRTGLTDGILVDSTYVPTSDITLYAEWIENYESKIVFNPNGGTVSKTTKIVMLNGEIGELPVPTREGYTFLGWYTGITDGYNVTPEYKFYVYNEVIYAHWRITNPTELDFDASSFDEVVDAYNTGNTSFLEQAMINNKYREIPLDVDNDGVFESVGYLRVANLSTPAECSQAGFSQSACGLVLEFADKIPRLSGLGGHRMNPYSQSGTVDGDGNYGGWEHSEMRNFVNSTIYNALPSDIKSRIINTTVVSGYGKNQTNNFTTTDKLYLLSTHEIYEDDDNDTTTGIDYYDTAYNNTRQLDYYRYKGVTTSNYSNSKKDWVWWLRSPYSNSNYYFYYVHSGGSCNLSGDSRDTWGVAPAFRVR